MLRCHFLKLRYDYYKKSRLSIRFRVFFKRNNHLNWTIVQQYQLWEQAGEGRRRTGRWWSSAIISVSRSAPVTSAGVACGAFIQALHFVGEGPLYQNTAWSQRCADLQILGLLISASTSVGDRVGFLPAKTCFCRTWGLNRFKLAETVMCSLDRFFSYFISKAKLKLDSIGLIAICLSLHVYIVQ